MTFATKQETLAAITAIAYDAHVPSTDCHLADIRGQLAGMRFEYHANDKRYRDSIRRFNLPVQKPNGDNDTRRLTIIVTRFEHNGRFEIVHYCW